MPDIAPLLIALLSLVATVMIGLAIAGRRDLSSPRCRRCKADLRDAAMSGARACACGADLSRRRAVRFPYRLRWRLFLVAATVAVAALLLGMAEVRALASGLGWRYVHPNWYFRLDWLTSSGNELDEMVLAQRVRDLRSRDDAEDLLGSMLRKPLPPGSSTFVSFAQVVEKAAPRGNLATQCATTIASWIDLDVSGSTIAFELWSVRFPLMAYTCPCVRVDQVKVDGVVVPFERDGDGFADGASDVWRRFGYSRIVARVPDMPLDGRAVEVEGEVLVLPFPVTGDWPMRDATLKRTAKPDEWGLEVMRAPITISTAPKAASASLPLPAPAPAPSAQLVALREWFTPFLGQSDGTPQPPRLAARTPIMCGVVGVIGGLCVLSAFLVVRRASCSRWRLDVAACLECGSRLRSEGFSLPERCPECGVAIVRRRVGYGRRNASVARAVTLGGIATVGLVVLAVSFLPRIVYDVNARVHSLLWDEQYAAAWMVEKRLDGASPIVARPSPRWGEWGRQLSPAQEYGSISEQIEFARHIGAQWANVDRVRTREGRPLSQSERVGWIYSLASGIAAITAPHHVRDPSEPLEEMQAALIAMRDAWGYPGVRLPRAVLVGDSILPRCAQGVDASVVLVGTAREFNPIWKPVHEAAFGVAAEVGVLDVSFAWSLKDLSDVEGCTGTIDEAVRVFPREGRVTVVTDPTLNPLDGGASVTLEVRETGDRDLVTIVADDALVGVTLAGSWRLGDPATPATLHVLTRQRSGPWAGLVSLAEWTGVDNAGWIDARPTELTATFVPDPDLRRTGHRDVRFAGIVWGSETTVRFRRVETSPSEVVTRYELVP